MLAGGRSSLLSHHYPQAAPTPAPGSGLRGLGDRIEALRGRLWLSSPAGGGTVVTAELPLRVASTPGPAG